MNLSPGLEPRLKHYTVALFYGQIFAGPFVKARKAQCENSLAGVGGLVYSPTRMCIYWGEGFKHGKSHVEIVSRF